MRRTAIVIPTFGKEGYTVQCFNSILDHTSDYVLIWVDNGSSAESRVKVQRSFAAHRNGIKIWNDKNEGFVGGVNAGIKRALADPQVSYIVIQNNDTVVTPRWLDAMRNTAEADAKNGVVGPVTTYGSPAQVWRFLWKGREIEEKNIEERAKALWKTNGMKWDSANIVTFFCSLFRREVFEGLGLLDRDYGVGLWDDQDMCDRMRRAGWKIAVALGAYVHHFHRTTFSSVYSTKQIEHMKKRNQGIYAKKVRERNRR